MPISKLDVFENRHGYLAQFNFTHILAYKISYLIRQGLYGRFEFQRQQNPINIDEIINSLQQEPGWQKPEIIEESLKQDAYFTFLRG